MIRVSHLHRFARFALATFIAMVFVTVVTPLLHAAAHGDVCSADGTKQVAAMDDGMPAHDLHDHAAHCPLCMPAGAPPAIFVLHIEPAQPLAHVRQSIPAARLASLVGAPLPARGPPSFA